MNILLKDKDKDTKTAAQGDLNIQKVFSSNLIWFFWDRPIPSRTLKTKNIIKIWKEIDLSWIWKSVFGINPSSQGITQLIPRAPELDLVEFGEGWIWQRLRVLEKFAWSNCFIN